MADLANTKIASCDVLRQARAQPFPGPRRRVTASAKPAARSLFLKDGAMSSFRPIGRTEPSTYSAYGDLDPQTAAAIAEQQSIYSSDNRENAKLKMAERIDLKSKHKTVLREGGGKVWEDPTLLEWDPSHFRLYCGNLGGEINDETLLHAFSAYKSVVKARVVRDKKTTKSKGFGFVSFVEPDDMLNAWRDLNGKYIGSHPVKLTKAETVVKPTAVDRNQLKSKQAKSAFAQNVVKAGRVTKSAPIKTSTSFIPRGVRRP